MANNRSGLVQQLLRWFESHGIGKEDAVVAGVSGGLDSMVLAEALLQSDRPFHVAHVNYGLRGADSEADEALVAAWCEERHVPFHVHRADMTSLQDGLQATARRIRYAFFETVRSQVAAEGNGSAWIALAHHGDDQAETVLLHLMRSADPLALSAMPAVDGDRHVLRPFLNSSRAQLAETAAAWGVPFREDASNAKPDYLRNRIRHEVLPLLNELRAGTTGHVAQWADRFGPLRHVLDQELAQARDRTWTKSTTGGTLDLDAWRREPLRNEIIFRAAQRFGIAARAVPEVLSLTEPQVESGAHFAASTARIERRGQRLVWTSLL